MKLSKEVNFYDTLKNWHHMSILNIWKWIYSRFYNNINIVRTPYEILNYVDYSERFKNAYDTCERLVWICKIYDLNDLIWTNIVDWVLEWFWCHLMLVYIMSSRKLWATWIGPEVPYLSLNDDIDVFC
jgi:hypothetical protein